MNATIELPRRMSALGRPMLDPCRRAAALSEFDRRLDNLRACVHWLVENSIPVIDSTLYRAGGVISVAASPRLAQLFRGDYAWRKREQLGTGLVKFTWFAVRVDTRIEWEDVCAL